MKDFKGNDIHVGDKVCFFDGMMKEGIVESFDEKLQDVRIEVLDKLYWRHPNSVFRIPSENNTNQELKVLRIVAKDGKSYDFDNITCILEKLWNKETLILKNVNDNSFVGRWHFEEIRGYFYI